MIECDNCGANLTLDDRSCPYCGATNQDAVLHISQLEKYKAIYENASDKILVEERGKNIIRIQIIVLAICTIVMLVTLVLSALAEDFRRDYDRKVYSTIKNRQYVEQMDEFVENTEPFKIEGYSNMHRRGFSDDRISISLRYVDCIEAIRLNRDRNRMAHAIEVFVSCNRNLDNENEPEVIKEYAKRLYKNISNSMRFYLKLSEDEVNRIMTCTDETSIEVLLKEYIDE